MLLDFVSTVKSAGGDIDLNGDPEHAGMQFRPRNEVNRKATRYLFPKPEITSANVKDTRDLPWAAECFELEGRKYTVEHMNHPDNPKGTRYSAYRDYGRFGAFAAAKVKAGSSLTLKYRIWAAPGELLDRAAMQQRWEAFAEPPKVRLVR